MLKEFREFALKGNALDLAIGKLLGGVDFSNLFIVLGGGTFASLKAAKDAGAATVNYGLFLNTVINFLIVAFVMFMVVRTMNALEREQPAPVAAPTAKDCGFCATAIPLKATRCPNCTSTL